MKTTYADIAKKLASKEKKYQDMLDVGTKQQRNSAMLMLKEIGQRKAMLVEENNSKAQNTKRQFSTGGFFGDPPKRSKKQTALASSLKEKGFSKGAIAGILENTPDFPKGEAANP